MNRRGHRLFLSRTALLVLCSIAIVGYLIFRCYGVRSDNEMMPPELFSAAAIESSFQNVPEQPPTAGSLKIPIFIYHSVRPAYSADTAEQRAYEVTPQLFERELKYLQDNGYTTITLDEMVRELQNGTTSPVAKPVVLTLDDGWQNQYVYAFPLLKKYHDTATFFIYTNPIGSKHFLTWAEVKEIDAAGMTIGDHTLSHPYLREISLDQIRSEVTESKKIIEQHLGKPVIHFASPFGYTSPDIQAIVKAAGYTTARTTYKGVYHSKDDMLKLTGILVSQRFDDFVAVLNQ